ncbi:MAG: fibronectin type III domain-containing protein [Nitrospira sp.]|nr:fibronectin type III domain-containing protein [Nitrospira sp.]
MRHDVRATTYQAAGSGHTHHPSAILRFWGGLGIMAIILGLASEGLACHTAKVTPTALTYYAVQGGANPPNQTITFSKTSSGTVTITVSDNATWLTKSPATTSMTTSAKITTAVNTSGLTAGTRSATVTIKMSYCTYTVPVSLVLSPSSTQPPPPSTSSATLTWNAVTGATITGYKVYIGETPGQYSRTITVGTVTSTTVNSLTVGKTYYFVVSAYNSAGESAPSNMASKTIQ